MLTALIGEYNGFHSHSLRQKEYTMIVCEHCRRVIGWIDHPDTIMARCIPCDRLPRSQRGVPVKDASHVTVHVKVPRYGGTADENKE